MGTDGISRDALRAMKTDINESWRGGGGRRWTADVVCGTKPRRETVGQASARAAETEDSVKRMCLKFFEIEVFIEWL